MLKDLFEKAMDIVTEETKFVGSKLSESIDDLKDKYQEAEARKREERKLRKIEEQKRKQELMESLKKSTETLKYDKVAFEKFGGRFEGDVNMAYLNKVNGIFKQLIAENKSLSNAFKVDSFDNTYDKEKLLFHNDDYSFLIKCWNIEGLYGNEPNLDPYDGERIEITNKENNKIWLDYGYSQSSNYDNFIHVLSFGFNKDCVSCLNVISSKPIGWPTIIDFVGVNYFYENYYAVKKILKYKYDEKMKEEKRKLDEEYEKEQLEKARLEKEKKEAQDKAFDSF